MKKQKRQEGLSRQSEETPTASIYNQTEHPKLRLEHITYRYGVGTPFEVCALDDVSLDIRRGSMTGIIGHTGSGTYSLRTRAPLELPSLIS